MQATNEETRSMDEVGASADGTYSLTYNPPHYAIFSYLHSHRQSSAFLLSFPIWIDNLDNSLKVKFFIGQDPGRFTPLDFEDS